MIVTEKIKLTSKDLFNILITSYLKKRWWLLAWIWVMIVILLVRQSNDSFGYFIVAALIFIQLIIAYQYWGYAKSKENNLLTQERYYEIDPDKIVGTVIDGTSTSIETRLFVSFIKTSKYYLLYTSKTEFIYLPISCFKSVEDINWFEREVIEKVRK